MGAHEKDQMLFERMHGTSRWENQPTNGWKVEDRDDDELPRTISEAVRRGGQGIEARRILKRSFKSSAYSRVRRCRMLRSCIPVSLTSMENRSSNSGRTSLPC